MELTAQEIRDQYKEIATAIGMGGVNITPKAAYVSNCMIQLHLRHGDDLKLSDAIKISKSADKIFNEEL